MVELLLLLGVATAIGAGLLIDTANDSSEDDSAEGFTRDEDLLLGGDGDDSLTTETIRDLIDLESEDGPYRIEGGAGNDLIDPRVEAERNGETYFWNLIPLGDVKGGAGDDTIHVDIGDGEIRGGGGNDSIVATSADNGMQVYGGNGDDTLDVRGAGDGYVSGGKGDDLILATGLDNAGTGFVIHPDGGEGEDTIRYFLKTEFNEPDLFQKETHPTGLLGGSDADLFEIVLDEGEYDVLDKLTIEAVYSPESSAADEDGYLYRVTGDGSQNTALQAVSDDTFRASALNIGDFVRGEDLISLQPSSVNENYDLASVRIEHTSEDSSTLIVSYESETSYTREIPIVVKTGGLTWDDVVVEGVDPDLLLGPIGPLGTFQLVQDTLVQGTDGDDSLDRSQLNRIDPPPYPQSVEFLAGGGDDSIDFEIHKELGHTYGNSLRVSLIDLGDGNDTLNYDDNARLSPIIEGGAGEDSIRVGGSTDTNVRVNGGDGNDTLDASSTQSGRFNGGAGDDLIYSRGGGWDGDGTANTAHGDEGQDTIVYNVFSWFDTSIGAGPQYATGGEGADRFELSLDEGALNRETSGQELTEWERDYGVLPDTTVIDDTTLRVQTMELPDFEVGVDVLALDIGVQNDEYRLTALSMEETEDGMTDVILTYSSETEYTRQVAVAVNGTGLSWSDVEVSGVDLSGVTVTDPVAQVT